MAEVLQGEACELLPVGVLRPKMVPQRDRRVIDFLFHQGAVDAFELVHSGHLSVCMPSFSAPVPGAGSMSSRSQWLTRKLIDLPGG
ncbi:MAG: hypothetical protein EHM15_12905 [Desulfobacteraceae bacterium]|nr:MAG: hypothetical protein EHM15_12905 [Desulfobacteraceae bacterium]